MLSDKIATTYVFENKYSISLSSREDWRTNKIWSLSNEKICYTDEFKNGDFMGTGVYGRLCFLPGQNVTIM